MFRLFVLLASLWAVNLYGQEGLEGTQPDYNYIEVIHDACASSYWLLAETESDAHERAYLLGMAARHVLLGSGAELATYAMHFLTALQVAMAFPQSELQDFVGLFCTEEILEQHERL